MHHLKFEAQLELLIGPHQGHEAGSSACLELRRRFPACDRRGTRAPELVAPLCSVSAVSGSEQWPQQQLCCEPGSAAHRHRGQAGGRQGTAGYLPANEPRLLLTRSGSPGAFVEHGSTDLTGCGRPQSCSGSLGNSRRPSTLGRPSRRATVYCLQLVGLQPHTGAGRRFEVRLPPSAPSGELE